MEAFEIPESTLVNVPLAIVANTSVLALQNDGPATVLGQTIADNAKFLRCIPHVLIATHVRIPFAIRTGSVPCWKQARFVVDTRGRLANWNLSVAQVFAFF